MPSTIAVPAPREFVRQLPSAQAAPFLVINDYTPSAEREEILNALADEGAAAPEIRRLTRWRLARLTLQLGREPTELEIAQAMLDLMHDLVRYEDDPVDHEEYSRPITTLRPIEGNPISPVSGQPKGKGDCDDMAVLFAAFARAAGLHSDVIWVDQRGGTYNHIASTVCIKGEGTCHWVEATIPGARVGETTREVVARIGVKGREDLSPTMR